MRRNISKAVFAAIIFSCTVLIPLNAQQSTEALWDYGELVARTYGQDQELVNGLQYYNRHPKSLGHPYLLEGWVHQGSVTLRGKLYSNIWLKYDIYAQQVEVEYRTMNGADNQVILVSDRVDNFVIGNYYFERLKLDEDLNEEQIYQVLGGGRLVIYIQWGKKLVPTSGDSGFIEEYTSPKRKYLLKLDESVQSFSSKKGFVKLFPESVQKDVKRLIKSNQLQFRTVSAKQLELFLLAAGNILEGAK